MTVPPLTMVPVLPPLGVDGPQAANSIVIKTSAPTPTDQKLRFLSILVCTSSGMRSSCAGVDSPSAMPYDNASPPAGLPTTPTCCVMRQPTSPLDRALRLVFAPCRESPTEPSRVCAGRAHRLDDQAKPGECE